MSDIDVLRNVTCVLSCMQVVYAAPSCSAYFFPSPHSTGAQAYTAITVTPTSPGKCLIFYREVRGDAALGPTYVTQCAL